MLDKPTTADEYPPGQLELVKATGLSLVVALGDLANDVVVVGGVGSAPSSSRMRGTCRASPAISSRPCGLK